MAIDLIEMTVKVSKSNSNGPCLLIFPSSQEPGLKYLKSSHLLQSIVGMYFRQSRDSPSILVDIILWNDILISILATQR